MVRFRVAAVLVVLAAALLPALPAAASGVPTGPVPAAAGPSVAGGDSLYGSGGRCTLAFNVSGRGILTGHCGPVGTAWYIGTSTLVGTVSWVASDNTAGLITITNPLVAQVPGLRGPAGTLPITNAARATVGRAVQKLSPITGLRSGTVTAVNATVYYAGGVIYGLDRTTLCPSAGEAGAPIFAGSTALSVTTGGSGNCSVGGTTYGRPVVPILQGLGLSIFAPAVPAP